jgi:uncharacterized membrane protein
MPDLLVYVVAVAVLAVVGFRLGMLLAPRMTRLDDRMARDEEADERDGDGRTTGR